MEGFSSHYTDHGTHQAQPWRLSVNGTRCHMDEDTEQAVQVLATCAQGTVPQSHHLGCGNCALSVQRRGGAQQDVISEYTQKGKLQLGEFSG